MGPKNKTHKAKVASPSKVATKFSSPAASRPVSPPPPKRPTRKKKSSELEEALDAAAVPPPPATATVTASPTSGYGATLLPSSAPAVPTSSRLPPSTNTTPRASRVHAVAPVHAAAANPAQPAVASSSSTVSASTARPVGAGAVALQRAADASDATADGAQPSSAALRLQASELFLRIPSRAKDVMQLADEPPLFPHLLAKPSTSEAVKMETLKKSADYALPLAEYFDDADAIFNNGDAAHRWVLLRAAQTFIVRRHGGFPWLVAKDVQLSPRVGAVAQRCTVVGDVTEVVDVTRVTFVSAAAVESAFRANTQGLCVEKLRSHPKDPVAAYAVDATVPVQTALRRIAFVCQSSVICRSAVKGATIKFAGTDVASSITKLQPLLSNFDCWLRQSCLRVFASQSRLLELRSAVQKAGFDVRLDDRTRRPTEWVPHAAAVAAAPPAAPPTAQWAIMSTAPISRMTIDAICKEIGATIDLADFSFTCCRIKWKRAPPKGVTLDAVRFAGTIVCRIGDVPCGAPPRQ